MSKTLDVMTHDNWVWGGSAGYARYEFSDSFVDEDGREFGAGPKSYLEVATTISGSVVTIPAYPDFPTTESAVINNGVTVTCWLLDSNRVKRAILFENCRIYTSLPSTISLIQLVLANGASRIQRDTDVWTKEQVIDYVESRPPAEKMTSAVYGTGRLAKPAAVLSDPMVVGDNDSRLNRVEVSHYATGGLGTLASPWTGWDTAITWAARTPYYARSGYYEYLTLPNWAIQGFQLQGEAGTVFKFAGSGMAMPFVGAIQGNGASGPTFLQVRNFVILGNALATHGLYVEACHRSLFENIEAQNITTAAFEFHFTVLNTYRRLAHYYFNTTRPLNGLVTNERNSAAEPVQRCTFEDIVIEECVGDGMALNHLWQSEIRGGTSEGNGGHGILVNDTCVNVALQGVDVEANAGTDDIIDNGKSTVLDRVLSTKRVTIGASARFPVINGGVFQSVLFNAGAKMPTVTGSPRYNILGSPAGTITSATGINCETEFFDFTSGTPSSAFWVTGTPTAPWIDAPYIIYRKKGNEVFIEGGVSGGTTGTITTLDIQYRPIRDHLFVCAAGTTSRIACVVEVLTTGVIRVSATNTAGAIAAATELLLLDGIHFKGYPYQ